MINADKLAQRNLLIKENGKKTRARRANMDARTYSLKISESRLTTDQKESLARVFLEAKWLRNAALASGLLADYDSKLKTVPVKTPAGFEDRELKYLGSHLRQAVLAELIWNIKTLSALKKKGRLVGKLKYAREIKSIHLKQNNVTFKLDGSRVKIQGLPGRFYVHGTKQLVDKEIATAKLVQKASGYYLFVTAFEEKELLIGPKQAPIGVDMGVKTHLTFSDGREFSVLVGESERLKRLQRKLQRQIKGSNNHYKTRLQLQREHEKMNSRKDEQANQIVSKLKQHEIVYFQDESLSEWNRRYGKQIHHSVLGRVKSRLQQLDSGMMLSKWEPTTQWCPSCKVKNKLALPERHYSCVCGYSAPRDLHAARNMILLGSKTNPGQELSSAPVDQKTTAGELVSLVSHAGLKQETNDESSNVLTEGSSVKTQESLVVA